MLSKWGASRIADGTISEFKYQTLFHDFFVR